MYRAPSFSWTSFDAVIPKPGEASAAVYSTSMNPCGQHRRTRWQVLDLDRASAHLIDCQMVPLDGDPFGRLASGFMKLRGSWLSIDKWNSWLDAQKGKGYPQPHIICYSQQGRSFLRQKNITNHFRWPTKIKLSLLLTSYLVRLIQV
jgi:hypothetical protein